MKPLIPSRTLLVTTACAVAACLPLSAQTFDFELIANDLQGTSSFNTDGNWSPANGNPTLEANSGASYGVGVSGTNRVIRTVGGAFGGAANANTVSLTLGNGTSRGTLQMVTSTTVNNLTMNSGTIAASGNFTLGGNVTLVGTNNEFNGGIPGRTLAVASTISGSGHVNIITSSNDPGTTTVRLTGVGNTYSGGTTIVGRNTNGLVLLDVQTEGALGSGNLTLNEFSRLTLGTGTSASNFIGDGATLSLATGLADGAINLNFTGMDTIGAISFDDGTTFGALGTYGRIGSNADFESALFVGDGMLNVIPEPSTTLLLLGVGIVALRWLSRRRELRKLA